MLVISDKLKPWTNQDFSSSQLIIIMPGRLVECPNCNRRVSELFKLTAEDIQRVHSPEEVGIYRAVCSDCREKFRSAARLEVDYGMPRALRDISFMTLFFSGVLFLLALMFPHIILFIDALILFSGIGYAFHELSGRYAFTHNLAWSMKNRGVMVGVSSVIATVVIVIVRGFS